MKESEHWELLYYRCCGCVCYLLGEVVVLVVGHAGGHMVDDLGGGGGVVWCGLACAAIPLETSHEATVSGEVHLHIHTHTIRHAEYIKNNNSFYSLWYHEI